MQKMLTRCRVALSLTLLSVAAMSIPSLAHAQSVRTADSLLQLGSLVRAESVYYAAARARPHDPIARWALGRYLVSRGAARVGATLFEESLRFGGEPSIVGRDLVPVYLDIGDYRALSALDAATPAERGRARWLSSHPMRVVAPDSVSVALFHGSSDSAIVGHLPIRLNGRTVDAAISATTHGIVVSDTAPASRGLHVFVDAPERATRSPLLATADSVGIGRLQLLNVPVTIVRQREPAAVTIGLEALARFAPTFDAAHDRLTLRTSGSIPPGVRGDRFETWATPSDLRLNKAGGWISITRPQIATMLRTHRWTLDARRGQVIVAP